MPPPRAPAARRLRAPGWLAPASIRRRMVCGRGRAVRRRMADDRGRARLRARSRAAGQATRRRVRRVDFDAVDDPTATTIELRVDRLERLERFDAASRAAARHVVVGLQLERRRREQRDHEPVMSATLDAPVEQREAFACFGSRCTVIVADAASGRGGRRSHRRAAACWPGTGSSRASRPTAS